MIRPATLADVPRIVEMGLRFQRTSRYATLLPENPAQMEALARQLVTGTDLASAILLVTRDEAVVGMIALLAYQHHISGERTASEIAFWVEPTARRAGLALLDAAEAWAVSRDCQVLELVSPDERVDRLYAHLGYDPSERTFRKRVGGPQTRLSLDSNIVVIDDVLADPLGYRQAALDGGFRDVQVGADLFQGIQLAPPTLTAWLQQRTPTVQVALSFFRQSPAGQAEPHYVHSDAMMGQWTGILYLTPDPPEGDGTAFYAHQATGARGASLLDLPRYAADFADEACWTRWWTVGARFNRLLLFPATYFHARALRDNYGTGDHARLVQVLFGGYAASEARG